MPGGGLSATSEGGLSRIYSRKGYIRREYTQNGMKGVDMEELYTKRHTKGGDTHERTHIRKDILMGGIHIHGRTYLQMGYIRRGYTQKDIHMEGVHMKGHTYGEDIHGNAYSRRGYQRGLAILVVMLHR